MECIENILNDIINRIEYDNIILYRSKYQTKIWRKNQYWYNNGKQNECEKYQLDLIYKITHNYIYKTHMRFNIEDLSFNNVKYPNKLKNGYNYTENIDGFQLINNKKLYYNLKFVCNTGGAQTRTLREVYYLIKCQLDFLLINNYNIYFVNILDGDESYRNMDKFSYLLEKNKYKDVLNNIFIGDMSQFQHWFNSFNK